jgi:hypothetical protein
MRLRYVVMNMSEFQVFAESIYVVDGPPVRALGIRFPTRMIIVKLADGTLWVNSPVSAAGPLLDRIRKLGPVRHLVAPTKLHVWRLEAWHALFLDAALWAPPQIPRRFKRLPFAGVLQDDPPRVWAGDFDQLVFRGNLFIEEVYFRHKKSRTVVFGDFIQNHAPSKQSLLLDVLLRISGVRWPSGGVPIDIRMTFVHRKAARQSLEKLLAWDFDKLILAHGVCIERDAKPFVERAFKWLQR